MLLASSALFTAVMLEFVRQYGTAGVLADHDCVLSNLAILWGVHLRDEFGQMRGTSFYSD